MKIDSEGSNRLDCEPAAGRSMSEGTRPHTLRRAGALIVVSVMVAIGFSALVQAPGDPVLDLSDNIVFYDDFEDSGTGGFDWWVTEDPPNQFEPFTGPTPKGQFEIDGSWDVHMNSPQGNQGFGFGQSTQFFIEPESDYLIAFDLMITAPYSGPYEGWFTAVDDGNIWLIIDGEYDSEHGSLTTSSRKGQILPPLTPLQFDKWYYLECRVHILEEEYDIYVNGVYQGTQYFDHGNSSVTAGFLTIGDTSYEPDAYGEAFWDNILVSHFVDYPWSDEIDMNIDDWTTIVTDTNYFGWWEGGSVGRPGSFVLRMQLNGRETALPPGHAKGVTPYYDQPRDAGYILSFWFMVQYPLNSEFKVVDDGRIWLMISPGGTDLAVYVDEMDVRYVDTLIPGVWHHILCRVDTQSSTYDLYLDDSRKDTYDFSQFEEEYFARPMAPKNLFMGGVSDDLSDGAEAYWDDFEIVADSDGDGLSDWEELNGYRGTFYHGYITDPFDPDTDGDGLIDSIEVGLSPYDSDPSTTTDPTDDDHDDDGLMDGTEDTNHDGYLEPGDWNEGAGPGETDPINPDTDGDRLTDGLEVGLENPEGSDTASPPWGTKIDLGYGPDLQPLTTTDPLDEDTDNDGIPDGWIDGWIDFIYNDIKDQLEFEDRDLDGERDGNPTFEGDSDWNDGYGPGETDPNKEDTDDDSISDYDEIDGTLGYLTDPLAIDSDGDYLYDGVELGVWFEDMDPQSNTDPLDKDTDDDGIYDGSEDANSDGAISLGETDPNLRDTDGDKLTDGQELGLGYPEGYDSYILWQNDQSSDTEGGLNGFAADADSGATRTDPLDLDTDDDGLPDGWKDFNANLEWDFGEFEDINLDGFVEPGEYDNYPGAGETDPNLPDTDDDEATDYEEIMVHSPSTSPLVGDTDGDDMPDGWEVQHGLDPTDPNDRNEDDAYDDDDVSNYNEYLQDTDPWDWDTDSDFISDLDDVNPLQYNTKNKIDPEYVLNDVDVVVVTSLQSEGRSFDVSVAMDYSTPSSILPIVYDASSLVENGVLSGVVAKIVVATDYHLSYTAVVKIKYESSELPSAAEENDLLMYYYDGEIDTNDDDVPDTPHWTLYLHENLYLHEDTSRDPENDFVWAKTNHLGYFAIADTTLNNIDFIDDPLDGFSDGEELNVAEYDPPFDILCLDPDDQGTCGTHQELRFDQLGTQTIYAKIWVVDGALEWVEDSQEVKITAGNYYPGSFAYQYDMTVCPTPGIRGQTYYAQSIRTPDFAGDEPSEVEIRVVVDKHNAEDALIIELRSNDGGEPSSTILGSEAVETDSDQWPMDDDQTWIMVVLSLSQQLSSNEKYWIVVRSPGTTSGSYDWNGADGYPDGNSAHTEDDGLSWTHDAGFDHGFEISKASYPVNPYLNVKANENDDTKNWEHSGRFTESVVVTDFMDDLNTFFGQFQAHCEDGDCTGFEGWIYAPFELYSSAKTELALGSLAIEVFPFYPDGDTLMKDTDGDGLADAVEAYFHTSWSNDDSDGDGLKDGEEVFIWGTNPFGVGSTDSDNDGLSDGDEVTDYHTNPDDPDTDGDSVNDDTDLDPMVDLTITVGIEEITQIDFFVDGPDWWGSADFYWCVTVESDKRCSSEPGEGRNKAHEYPAWEETWDVPDDDISVEVKIELWDDDLVWDDIADISEDPGGGDENNPQGSDIEVFYNLANGHWIGDDSLGDRNGYGHVSGDEDGSVEIKDGVVFDFQDDCELWFEITSNDFDGDGVPYSAERFTYGTDPSVFDDDADGMPTLWEHRYGFDYTDPSNAQVDSDGDHLTNIQEYDLDTDPTHFEVNLWVSFDWDVDNSYMTTFISAMRKASDFIYDVTDGYLYFRNVFFDDNSQGWNTADIQVHQGDAPDRNDPNWPRAAVGGFDNWPNAHITLPETFSFIIGPVFSDYFKMIAHEFGHYGMHLGDEYYDDQGNMYPRDIWQIRQGPPGFMNAQGTYSEMTTPTDYQTWSPPPGFGPTHQWDINNQESCWETFFSHYSTRVWFDFNNDGTRDTTFPSDYEALHGPGVTTNGRYLIVGGNW